MFQGVDPGVEWRGMAWCGVESRVQLGMGVKLPEDAKFRRGGITGGIKRGGVGLDVKDVVLTIEEVRDVKVDVKVDGTDGTDGTGSPEGMRGTLGVEDEAARRVAKREDVEDGVDCVNFRHLCMKRLSADMLN
jgi:hypothetical protein